jgi:hypothetical protein
MLTIDFKSAIPWATKDKAHHMVETMECMELMQVIILIKITGLHITKMTQMLPILSLRRIT